MVSGGQNKIDITRQRFGRLVVKEENGRYIRKKVLWKCICDCGNETTVVGGDLRNGTTKSCGCLSREMASERNSGKNSPNWNPNLTDEERKIKRRYPEYIKWRREIFARDDYTCNCCSKRAGKLVAHHLEGYKENLHLRTTLDNGITMCKNCHLDFHFQYGRRNNTKKQFEEFVENYLLKN